MIYNFIKDSNKQNFGKMFGRKKRHFKNFHNLLSFYNSWSYVKGINKNNKCLYFVKFKNI